MYYTSLKTFLAFQVIQHVEIRGIIPICMLYCKFENLNFDIYIMDKHIFFNIPKKVLKFGTYINDGLLKGSVFQILFFGLSFYLMESKKYSFKKVTKSFCFLT